MQTTVNSEISWSGVGVHTGEPCQATVRPASANHGIKFKRLDVEEGRNIVPALYNHVTNSGLCSELENSQGVSVSTVEHLMAALAGCGVHNAMVEMSGPEVPILDGSSLGFARDLVRAGTREMDDELRIIKVLKPVSVSQGLAEARLDPSDTMEIDFRIDFPDKAIGKQSKSMNIANGAFLRLLCNSRTFCRQQDVKAMRESGKGLGGSLDNAIVIDGEKVLSNEGFRHSDECVRHKILDAMGDLALAGYPMVAKYSGNRAGHALTNKLLRKLFSDPEAHEIVACDSETRKTLPGTGITESDRHLLN